jgi:hypothetical protein
LARPQVLRSAVVTWGFGQGKGMVIHDKIQPLARRTRDWRED